MIIFTKHAEEKVATNEARSFGISKNLIIKLLDNPLVETKLPKDIIRAKGFVITNEGSFLLNSVFGRLDYEEFPSEKTELVFIGKQIGKHEDELKKRLAECETDQPNVNV